MFSRILRNEIKVKLKSLSIMILSVSLFLFYYTQFIGDINRTGIKPIPPRDDFYANDSVEEHESSLDVTLEDYIKFIYETMKSDYESGETLRIKGINRYYEKLNEEQRQFLASAIVEMENTTFKNNYEYEAFAEKIDKALGGNTVYSEENNFLQIIRSRRYNDSQELYNSILKEDKLTNAYARLYADYIGISMGFFTVFVTAFTLVKDKRYNVNELIYTTEISSYKYILGKYLADVLVTAFLVLLTAGHATWVFYQYSKLTGDSISYLAFFKYSILWIFPTIMFVTSLSYVLQLMFNNGIVPIIVQFFYWMYSMIPLVTTEVQPLKYFIRFNKVVPYSEIKPFIDNINLNRILITVFSLGLLLLAVKLWDRKRGDINNGFSFRKKGVLP